MGLLGTLLVFTPVALGFFVAASYAGTMLALKRYHEDETFDARDAFRIEDDGGDENGDR